jgi:hypothetical protein
LINLRDNGYDRADRRQRKNVREPALDGQGMLEPEAGEGVIPNLPAGGEVLPEPSLLTWSSSRVAGTSGESFIVPMLGGFQGSFQATTGVRAALAGRN